MYTSLNEILKHGPCGKHSDGVSGFSRLLKFLNKDKGDDEPLSFTTILESNGISDAIWCLRTLPGYDLKVMEFKLKCARRVEYLDKSGKTKECLDIVARFIAGDATRDDLRAAADDAYAAYAAADGADTAYTAYAAYAAADDAAYAAAAAAAYAADAAYAAYAADAAADAAYAAYAAADAAYAAAAAGKDREGEFERQGNFILDFLKSGKHLFLV